MVCGMDEDVAKKWGLRVRAAREAAGLTQAQLAGRSQLSQQKVSQIESGRPGGDDSRRAVARALGVRPVDLFPYPEDLQPAVAVGAS